MNADIYKHIRDLKAAVLELLGHLDPDEARTRDDDALGVHRPARKIDVRLPGK